ncbi:hypothetical protein PENARI_c165G06255 [Penicillium arizonense]|uniref:Acyl-CoA dehydrogenase/oxidase C-terminal domain-containing protein n=1 Tax=Penicillium arizonense TaxID=1835702 RepID=A0A1F5L0B5_PENAI|nr:hypothetical protein PENARI_c165G06255 [Penicillium arizonense]OGE46614.1 hypothetical protein PENARI_c165G06255 [Penicillium arizonense]
MSVSSLINSQDGHIPASKRIPAIARPSISDRAKHALDIVEKFVEEECILADAIFEQQLGEEQSKKGPQFSTLEYGLMAEYLGKSRTASEATNCSAPDTGNMEVLAKYGTEAQKSRWLTPLLNGEIRSAFLMTEPDVASSDATNIGLQMYKDGDYWVLNGQKWWSSGTGNVRCKIYLVMGKSDPSNTTRYKQHSVILVPANTPGLTVSRVLSVIGFDHAPEGHGHVRFDNVRVPAENMILSEGRGFEVVQGRLGPGRIHHAMRSIGGAERALDWFLSRISDPTKWPFGQRLADHGIMLERVAQSRMEIDSARLVILNAAIIIDELGGKGALKEIAEAKVQSASVLLNVVDRAIQAYGAAGVSQDTPLAALWAHARTMRIVDGPDEVHMLQLGRNESKRGDTLRARIETQKVKAAQLFRRYHLEQVDSLELNRTPAKAYL